VHTTFLSPRVRVCLTTTDNISTQSGHQQSAAVISAITIRKITLRIIPFIFLLYIVAFLDRINISFASLTMNSELGIDSEQYGLLVGVFFLGYFIFEIPSNLLLHKIGARVWVARILITWGILAALTGFARNVHELYALRFALGTAEAGFAPGMLLYLTYWFPKKNRARAVGLYLSGMPIATILGAPLSGLILDHVHWGGLSSWRWLFLLQGVPAIALGALTYFVLPARPEHAKFLAANERDWRCTELGNEVALVQTQGHLTLLSALASSRVWALVAIYFGILTGLYAFNFFAPQLIKTMAPGVSNGAVTFLVMLPSLVGLAAMIVVSRHSDRVEERRYHVAIPVLVGGAALLLLATTGSLVLTLVLLCGAAIGVYGFFGPFWALPGDFLTGYAAASGLALINACGNLAGFFGPYMIGTIAERTGSSYAGLMVAGLAMMAAAGLVSRLPVARLESSRSAG
jgi:MFS transporter, ACS family, tartrate transporter